MSDIIKMHGKLFLLAVACVSFVQVRGDHNSENLLDGLFSTLAEANHFADLHKAQIQPKVNKTSDEELEDVILEGLLVADSIHKLTTRLFLRQWTNLNDVRKIIFSNSTEYAKKADADEERILKAVYKASESVREEARYLENSKLIVQCIDRVENKACKDLESYKKTFVADIWHLNLQFNKTYPEYPFLMIEEVLKHPFNETVQLIKGCQDTACVQAAVKKYNIGMSDLYNSYLREVTSANTDFIAHQQEVYRLYRRVTRAFEKNYLTTTREMRKCLYIRPALLGKLLGFG